MLFLIILLASLLIRLQRFDFPASYTFAWGDGTRDYLVADHILRFHEFPLTGPFNLLNDFGIHTSPIYFYLLSLFLIPFNNILTLSFVNILLQLGVIILIYKVTKRFFDYPTAIIATLLFSFNPEVIKQADFIWQPYLSLPFALLALYFNVSRPYLSLGLISFATSLHYSTFPWLPVLLFQQRSVKFYIGAFFVIFLSLSLFCLPLVFFHIQNGFPDLFQSFPAHANSLTSYFSNLEFNIEKLLSAFYINHILAVLLLIAFFLALKIDSKKRRNLVFIFILLISPIIMASFFNKIRLHYLILSVGLLPILVARITYIFKPAVRNIIVVILVLVFSGNLSFLRHDFKKPLQNQKRIDKISVEIITELNKIKTEKGYTDLNFFQFMSYSNAEVIIPYPVLDTFLLVYLEEKLGLKLAEISDQTPYNLFQINKKDYLLVSCFKLAKNGPDCISYFKSNNDDYSVLKLIYNDESVNIYLAKHEQI